MSTWDSNAGTVVEWAPARIESHPGWACVDCGCCGGLTWGGEEPRECYVCHGGGWLCVHLATGTLATHPGGSLLGARMGADELARLRERLGETTP